MNFANQEEINRQALFADENEEFRIPAEPDEGQKVILRFRTARDNIDNVYYQEAGMTEEEPLIKTNLIPCLITISWKRKCLDIQ